MEGSDVIEEDLEQRAIKGFRKLVNYYTGLTLKKHPNFNPKVTRDLVIDQLLKILLYGME